jgi:hypothetical protein
LFNRSALFNLLTLPILLQMVPLLNYPQVTKFEYIICFLPGTD